jgi:hypothetical protein
MKKNLLLLAILGGLIAFAVVYQKNQNATLNTAARTGVKQRELLVPDLQATATRKFVIKDDKGSVTISIADDMKSAVVAERGGYPASIEKLGTAITDLSNQAIAQKQEIRKGAWAKYKLKAPGDGTEGIGTQIELKDGGDKALATLILGSNTETSGTGNDNPMMGGSGQRLVRTPQDGETIWQVSNTFFDLEAKPENWVDKSFIDVQKIKTITVAAPKAEDSWSIKREKDSDTDFVLADAKPSETLDNTKITAGSLLSTPSFNDVNGKDKAAELLKDAVKAKIVTFDGYTYDVQVAKQSKDGSDKFYMSVNVAADLPKARTPVKDEKEEDKKKADEAFAADKKTKEDKLAKEQKFAGWVYEVSEYTVNNLLKKRSEIVKLEVPKAETPPPAGTAPAVPATSAAPAAPAAPVSVTTPPVSVTTPPVSVPPAPAKPEGDAAKK